MWGRSLLLRRCAFGFLVSCLSFFVLFDPFEKKLFPSRRQMVEIPSFLVLSVGGHTIEEIDITPDLNHTLCDDVFNYFDLKVVTAQMDELADSWDHRHFHHLFNVAVGDHSKLVVVKRLIVILFISKVQHQQKLDHDTPLWLGVVAIFELFLTIRNVLFKEPGMVLFFSWLVKVGVEGKNRTKSLLKQLDLPFL